jgi:hypothetical protein
MISNKGLLYIEPTQPASTGPALDHLTRKMTGAFRKARPSRHWRGFHECICGAYSTSCDYRLPNGAMTNSLCVHYVAHHRSEVPANQLARIEAFAFGEVEPNEQELQGPDVVLLRVRASVQRRLGADRLRTWMRWGLAVENLARSLRGGCLPARQGLSHARADAEDLLTLLGSIRAESLSGLQTVVEQDHGDVHKWAAEALPTPGWRRELWVSPLVALLQGSKGIERTFAAMNLRLLGTAAAAAVPTLLELATREAADPDYQHDLSLALNDLGRMLGVSLLAQIPPRPGQVGICTYCNGSGDCFCRRKGTVIAEECARCDGSGKCHVCQGSGRLGQ